MITSNLFIFIFIFGIQVVTRLAFAHLNWPTNRGNLTRYVSNVTNLQRTILVFRKRKTYVPAISWYVLVMIKSALFMASKSAVN